MVYTEEDKKRIREERAKLEKEIKIPPMSKTYHTPYRWKKDYLASQTNIKPAKGIIEKRDEERKNQSGVTTMDSIFKTSGKKEVIEPKMLFTEKELKEKSFVELREIGESFNLKGRSRVELVREIMEAQQE